jgi:drug/metabolite transporter (DMT)-like permease
MRDSGRDQGQQDGRGNRQADIATAQSKIDIAGQPPQPEAAQPRHQPGEQHQREHGGEKPFDHRAIIASGSNLQPPRARLNAWLTRASPVLRAMIWAFLGGGVLALLNAVTRQLAMQIDPVQTLFLRYAAAVSLMLPLLLRSQYGRLRSGDFPGHLVRGLIHTIGLAMWFTALPHVSLADTTAIGFTTPIFLMMGAGWLLGEEMVTARWIAVAISFVGVLIVVAPGLGGSGGASLLLMLASAPMFAGTMLLSKRLSLRDGPALLVFWQALCIMLLSAPWALFNWQPVSPDLWGMVVVAGLLGSLGQYCMTRSFHRTDISATQSVRFLDLVWASLFGFLFFADLPSHTTLLGGAIILAASLWIARREARPRSTA